MDTFHKGVMGMAIVLGILAILAHETSYFGWLAFFSFGCFCIGIGE
jgi:hypothetical protein